MFWKTRPTESELRASLWLANCVNAGNAHDFRMDRPLRERARGSAAGDTAWLLKARVHTPGNLLRNLCWRAQLRLYMLKGAPR